MMRKMNNIQRFYAIQKQQPKVLCYKRCFFHVEIPKLLRTPILKNIWKKSTPANGCFLSFRNKIWICNTLLYACGLRAYVPTCPRSNVPKVCQHFIFTCQRANKPANITTCQKTCQFFIYFSKENIFQYLNFSMGYTKKSDYPHPPPPTQNIPPPTPTYPYPSIKNVHHPHPPKIYFHRPPSTPTHP